MKQKTGNLTLEISTGDGTRRFVATVDLKMLDDPLYVKIIMLKLKRTARLIAPTSSGDLEVRV